jgi:hypothetical protein
MVIDDQHRGGHDTILTAPRRAVVRGFPDIDPEQLRRASRGHARSSRGSDPRDENSSGWFPTNVVPPWDAPGYPTESPAYRVYVNTATEVGMDATFQAVYEPASAQANFKFTK